MTKNVPMKRTRVTELERVKLEGKSLFNPNLPTIRLMVGQIIRRLTESLIYKGNEKNTERKSPAMKRTRNVRVRLCKTERKRLVMQNGTYEPGYAKRNVRVQLQVWNVRVLMNKQGT